MNHAFTHRLFLLSCLLAVINFCTASMNDGARA
jgi:hypothetical protein